MGAEAAVIVRFLCVFFFVCSTAWAIEATGRDYSLRLEGQKSMHFEKRLATRAPIGFYEGTDRREELQLAINGELYQRIKVQGEIENAGSGDDEGILWLSFTDRVAGLTMGRFNAGFSGSRLFCVDRRVEGGAAYIERPWVRAEALVSRPNGTPCYEKIPFSGRGEYFIKNAPVVFQSETVALEGETLQRGRDYIFDYTTGRFYFTPRFLAEHALEESRDGSRVHVAYEALSESGMGLNGGRVVLSPFSFLKIGGVGLAEQVSHGDSSTGIGETDKTRYGYGAIASLGKDSLAYLRGEVGFQEMAGQKKAFAGAMDGRISFGKALVITGEYENFDSAYVQQGNTPVEPGLARRKGSFRFQPVPAILASAEYSDGGYDGADIRVREKEGFARADLRPERLPWVSAWAKQRRVSSDSSFSENVFFHGEVSKNLGWGGLAAGGEYEAFSGMLGAGNIEERVPVFIKAHSAETGRVQYQLLAGAEKVRYVAYGTGAPVQDETRGRASAIVSGSLAGFNASATGAALAGGQGLLENSLEGSFDGSVGRFTTVSARLRDALQTSRLVETPDSLSVERRTFATGEVRCTPFSFLSLDYAPVFRKRRDQKAGATIVSEIRHSGEASLGKGRLKGTLNADLLRRSINEQIQSHGREEMARATLQALLPFSLALKMSTEYGRRWEDELSPLSGDARSKYGDNKKGEAVFTMPVGEKGIAELGLSHSSLLQRVSSVQTLDRDSSYLTTPYGMELSEAYVNIDQIERALETGYAHRGGAWEAGLRLGVFYTRDFLSPEGNSMSGETTKGLRPALNLLMNPGENFSASIVVSGAVSQGYVQTNKGEAEAALSYTYKLLTANGRTVYTVESTRYFSTRFSEFFLDLLLRI